MSTPHRIGVIGRTGRGDYGHELDTAWLAIPGCRIVAVADDDKTGLAAAAKRLKLEAAASFADYRQMLDKARPTIVAICTRWVDQHRDMVLAAAERGIHVYIEKPLCRSLEEADEIVTACEKTHVKLAVAHPTHYSPKLAAMKKLIEQGKIGRVLEYRGRGKEDARGGSEDLWVLGSHVLDMIRVLGGQPAWCFARLTQGGEPVTARHVKDGNEGLGPLAGDAVHAMFGMADGSTAHFSSVKNAAGRPSRYGLQVFGSQGVLEIVEGILPPLSYLGDPSWSPGRSRGNWQQVSTAGIDQPEPLQGDKFNARHTLAILDLLEAIEKERQPLLSAEEARGIVEMIAAIFESHRVGGLVTLPLENRQNPLGMLPA